MIISKYEKKLMSIIMIAVIVLSGFICAPKADAADTAKPEVTVLGATLRLNKEGDNKNAQSMRIGIKITNADKAKDCAIKLELNGKSYTVATSEAALDSENGKVHNNVHSIDKTNNSVVYAVVLTNIPKTSFYDSITITGKAISNDEQETITTSTAEQRNVMGIVNSLQKKYPYLGITINDNGTLVKNNSKDLTNNDLNGYNTNDPQEYETVKLEPDKIYDHVTKDEQGNIIIDETGESIIHFPINPVTVGDTVIVHITGTIGDNSAGLHIYPDAGDDHCMVESYEAIKTKGVLDKTIEYVISKGEAKTICIKGPDCQKLAKDITITSLSVTYKGGNPAPTATPVPTPVPTEKPVAESFNVPLSADVAPVSAPNGYMTDPSQNIYNEDGSVSFLLVNNNQNRVNGFYFNADKTAIDLNDYSKIVITVSSNTDNFIGEAMVITSDTLNVDNASMKQTNAVFGKAEHEIIIDLSDIVTETAAYGVGIQNQGWRGGDAEPTLTIKSIKVIAKSDNNL